MLIVSLEEIPMQSLDFSGVFTALVTPFTANGAIDEKALRTLVDHQIAGGIHGLVPVGTTGESPTVTHKENIQVIKIVLDQAAGRVPVIAGTGSNSTAEAIDMTGQAKELGAAASLQVAPYYNKPNQDGLYQHFWTIAQTIDLPMVVYNIQGRSGVNIETSTVLALAAHSNIRAVKEASGNIGQIMEVLAKRPKTLAVLSGDDNLFFPLMALGGHGVISVASNLIPKPMVELYEACTSQQWSLAKTKHFELLNLFKTMFLDTNPIPIKFALSLTGMVQPYYRLPMTPPSSSVQETIRNTLRSYQIPIED
jgi:4-hydroxy-tetrahydrodipicolinate synthase